MARDYMHTGDVVEAVISVLRGADGAAHTNGLPANWFRDAQDGDEVPLVTLEHGDLADFVSVDEVLKLTPAIFVRGLGTVLDSRLAGGCIQTTEPVRIIHVRRWDDCRDSSGDTEQNMTRARERYAKLIHNALFNDDRLRTIDSEGSATAYSITCADSSGAQILPGTTLRGWDLGHDAGSSYAIEDVSAWRNLGRTRSWAIGCEIEVRVKSGP